MSETITPEVVATLATKLAGMELTDDERQLLDTLLERAAEADVDVEGYGVVYEIEVTAKDRQPLGREGATGQHEWVGKVGRAIGADLSPLGVWTDMRP